MTNEQIQALKARYAEPETPNCRICGAKMSIQRAGGGSIVYGCDGRVEGDGYAFKEGRDFSDKHYEQSRETVYNLGDADVIALLAEREADKKTISAQHTQLVEERRDLMWKINQLEQKHCGSSLMEREVHHVGVVNKLMEHITALSGHLRNAHAFIESTEAFGEFAETGIVSCDGAEWDIDASKAALSNSPEAQVRTLTLPPKIERNDADEWWMYKGRRVGGGCAMWYNKAIDDVAIFQSRTLTVKLPKPHAHLIWIQAGYPPDDYWDDVAVSHSVKDRCCDGSERYPVYSIFEIQEACAAAGITLVVGGE